MVCEVCAVKPVSFGLGEVAILKGQNARIILIFKEKFGAPDRIRTCDLRLRRAPLYPAELRVHMA